MVNNMNTACRIRSSHAPPHGHFTALQTLHHSRAPFLVHLGTSECPRGHFPKGFHFFLFAVQGVKCARGQGAGAAC